MEEDLTMNLTPLAELVPGVGDLPGVPGPRLLGGPLARYLDGHDRLTWSHVASMSPSEIARLPNVGPVRTARVIEELSAAVAATHPRRREGRSVDRVDDHGVVDALVGIASWATGTGLDGSLLDAVLAAVDASAADAPVEEVELLRSVAAEKLADPDLVARHDPVRAAEHLLVGFDDRERATLERILDFDGSAPTLQQIGEQYSVSRERIRQVEGKVRAQLDAALVDPQYRSLVAAAHELRRRLGAAVPSDELVDEFAEYPPDLLDRLILHLAGPYRFDGNWYVLAALGSFDAAVWSAFESAAHHGVAPRDALEDALSELGLRGEFTDRAIGGDRRLRTVDADVVDWTGSLASKCVIALHRSGVPLQFDELVEFVQPNSERGMANQIHADDRIVRVGIKRYALAEWNMDTFEGIAPTMQARLADGPREVDVLGAELAEEFGVSPSSVRMLASQHPAFLLDAAVVMLRPVDRPYVPSSDLVRSRCCYVVDGVWSWRVPVDRDVLRGSGRHLPEAFAVHLGVSPLESGSVDSPVGPIQLRWGHLPAIGSLRSLARSLDAEEGDWMFVRRTSPSSIDAVRLRAQDVPEGPDGALRALVGARGSDAPVERVLADALGLRGTVNHDLAEEREVLVDRREHDLVQLVDRLS